MKNFAKLLAFAVDEPRYAMSLSSVEKVSCAVKALSHPFVVYLRWGCTDRI